SEQREDVRRHAYPGDPFRFIAIRQTHRFFSDHRDLLEDAIRLLQISDVGIRNWPLNEVLLLIFRPNNHQLLGIAVRQRREQHGVDHAEDRRIGADSQRQREYNDQTEAPPLAKATDGITHVLKKTLHLPALSPAQRHDMSNMMAPVPFVVLQQGIERQRPDFWMFQPTREVFRLDRTQEGYPASMQCLE